MGKCCNMGKIKGTVSDRSEIKETDSTPSIWFNLGGVNDSQGIPAESDFQKCAEARGWSVSPATRSQNKREHWDFSLRKGSDTLRVEVKGQKRIGRGNQNFSNDLVWVELRNSYGGRGWLYGDADAISFDFAGYIVLVWRKALLAYTERVVVLDAPPVRRPEDALYKGYTRMDRSDCLALIKVTDLLRPEIFWEVWGK